MTRVKIYRQTVNVSEIQFSLRKLFGIGLPNKVNSHYVLNRVRLCFKMAGKSDHATERTCVEYIMKDIYVGKGLYLGCMIRDLING